MKKAMKKKTFVRSLALISLALSSSTVLAETTLRFGHVLEVSHPLSLQYKQVADEVAEATNGEVKIELFPAGTLGSQSELVEGLSLGTVDITSPGSAFLGSIVPDLSVTSAPYVFRDMDHFASFTQSDVMENLANQYHEETGNHILSVWYYGTRHLTANKPVHTPEDARGMKIRIPDASVYALFPRSIGANPTPIAFSEVYLGLQQGVVDGQENPLSVIQSHRFYEVQDNIVLTGHLIDNMMPVISGFAWDKLSEEQQQAVSDAFLKAAEESIGIIQEEEDTLKTAFIERGINVIEPDTDAFAEAARTYLTSNDMRWDQELFQSIQDIQ
ncbi:sialic acid TRAP transporter substrate-binding protein SiaP [Halomonas colorata]|uniref:sialic acid TRAP transporter substrate-binding protein SiaP n=1 Tax=Halomonas colorata TaxID=2742615 RepID=UPI001866F423|nr:sialic acid TRAP transporter substrate-binding protein SiaP [Halomonas colorata]